MNAQGSSTCDRLHRTGPKTFAALITLTWILALLTSSQAFSSSNPRIAHAGGQVGSQTYTNSIEALDANYALGFRFFEIDFSWTSDRRLVCLHDWQVSFTRSFGITTETAVSLQQFEELVRNRAAFKKCTLTSLIHWLSQHSDAVLVTDVKEDNIGALEKIAAIHPQLRSQIVPQIYQPEEYSVARELGFTRVIWTLYRYVGSDAKVIGLMNELDIWAVTMNTTRAGQGLVRALGEMGIRSYVHTINSYADYLYFLNMGVDEIYTDRLSSKAQQRREKEGLITLKNSAFYHEKIARESQYREKKERFSNKQQALYSLDNKQLGEIIFINQIGDITLLPEGFEFIALGSDAHFSLPEIHGDYRKVKIYIDLQVPVESRVEVFYGTSMEPRFSSLRKLSQPTFTGENQLVFTVSDENPVRRIRIDPGTVAGSYRIKSLQLRAD